MTLVVPFDGSALSKMALVRAAQFDTVLEEGVVAVSAIPSNNADYAREQGWLQETEPFDEDKIVGHLREVVSQIAPAAEFHDVYVDRYAPVGTIAKRLRRFAREQSASIVFVGSENAGRVASAFTVGTSVTADRTYDTMIVSQIRPTTVEKLKDTNPSVRQVK